MNNLSSKCWIMLTVPSVLSAGIVIPLILLLSLVCADAQVSLRIGYAQPWTAGVETTQKVASLKGRVYTTKLVAQKGYLRLPASLAQNRLDMAMILHNQWVFSIIGGQQFVPVASIGPHLAIVERKFLNQRRKRVALYRFLKDWQKVWHETGYPYGVQPPNVKFLSQKFVALTRIAFPGPSTWWKKTRLEKFVVEPIKGQKVEWNQKQARIMVGDYFRSIGRQMARIRNAKPGESYTGTNEGQDENFLLLDRNPCNGWMVNFRSPYETQPAGSKECDGQMVRLIKATQR